LVSGPDLFITKRIVIGVDSVVIRESVEKVLRHGSDEITVGVGDTASAEAGRVKGAFTSLGAYEVRGKVTCGSG